jgi:hypothetical protein
MNTEDGKIVFPDGLNYQLLVLPDIKDIPDNVIQKVKELVDAGAKVLVQNPEVAARIKGDILTYATIDEALAALSIAKDFSRDAGKIDFIHRNIDGMDVYFLSNKMNQSIRETVEFRSTGEQVEYWDPVSAGQFIIADAEPIEGITKVNLSLPAHGSAFIVFTREARILEPYNSSPQTQTATSIESPWKLSFPESWGAPSSVELEKLISWTDHKEKGITYFSGTARYENTFSVSPEAMDGKQAISIDLGEVYDLAEIIVNGKSAGVLWTYPYQLDIRNLVQEGENTLEIKITNLWVNRLIGDLDLPEDKKFTRTSRPFVEPYERNTPDIPQLRTSGLLGPVVIKMVAQ